MLVTYNPPKEISLEEKARIKKEIEEAKKRPIVFDEDCPEVSDEDLQRAVAERNARKAKQHA